MSDKPSVSSELDHAYFQALEAAFIRLRGAPLLLSPADWQVAKEWRRQGVPIELVIRVMERVFERRSDRQGTSEKRSGIRSLRYFRTAVERSWQRILELGGGETGSPDAEPIDIPARLARLAEALKSATSGCDEVIRGTDPMGQARAQAIDGVAERIIGLDGDAASVEGELQRLDRRVLKRLREVLDVGTLATLKESVEDSLTELSDRLAGDARDQTLELLLWRRLRQEANLPVLSLFSTESRSSSTKA